MGSDAGLLVHAAGDPRDALTDQALATADPRDRAEVQHAVALFRGRAVSREEKRSAIVTLARLLEERRPLVEAALNKKDAGALFQIANEFDLRHRRPPPTARPSATTTTTRSSTGSTGGTSAPSSSPGNCCSTGGGAIRRSRDLRVRTDETATASGRAAGRGVAHPSVMAGSVEAARGGASGLVSDSRQTELRR